MAKFAATRRLVAGQPVGRRAALKFLLEIEIPQRLPGRVADDEAGVVVLLEASRVAGSGARMA